MVCSVDRMAISMFTILIDFVEEKAIYNEENINYTPKHGNWWCRNQFAGIPG